MASGAAIVFAPVLLEDRNRSRAPLTDNFRGDLGAGDDRLTDDQSALAMQQLDLVDLHGMSDITRK